MGIIQLDQDQSQAPDSRRFVTLNVGGRSFTTSVQTLVSRVRLSQHRLHLCCLRWGSPPARVDVTKETTCSTNGLHGQDLDLPLSWCPAPLCRRTTPCWHAWCQATCKVPRTARYQRCILCRSPLRGPGTGMNKLPNNPNQ